MCIAKLHCHSLLVGAVAVSGGPSELEHGTVLRGSHYVWVRTQGSAHRVDLAKDGHEKLEMHVGGTWLYLFRRDCANFLLLLVGWMFAMSKASEI